MKKRALQAAEIELENLRTQNDYKDRLIAVSILLLLPTYSMFLIWSYDYFYLGNDYNMGGDLALKMEFLSSMTAPVYL